MYAALSAQARYGRAWKKYSVKANTTRLRPRTRLQLCAGHLSAFRIKAASPHSTWLPAPSILFPWTLLRASRSRTREYSFREGIKRPWMIRVSCAFLPSRPPMSRRHGNSTMFPSLRRTRQHQTLLKQHFFPLLRKPLPPEAIAPTTSPVSAVNEENACASFSEFQGSATGSALRLTSVSPLSVSQSGQNTVTLTGEGFICVTTITIGEKTLSGESDFVVASNSSITLSSGLLPVGIFDIVMNDSLGSTVTLLQAITITR